MQALVLLPEWQCETCTAMQKIMRGCESPAEKPIIMDGEPQLRCPRRLLLDRPQWVSEIWWLYSKFVDGILPESGGLSDQPAKFIMAVRLLESAKSTAEVEKQERERRRQSLQAQANRAFNAG